MATMKAKYIPRNPGKIVGNPNNILCRSSWEVHVCKFFDLSSSVIRWGSEILPIKYISPFDKKMHTYWPDYVVTYKHENGNEVTEIVEVKPLKETSMKYARSEYDKQCVLLNEAKWHAASVFASSNGMTFRIITEMSIFKSNPELRKTNKKTNATKKSQSTKPTVGTTKKSRKKIK